MKAAEKRSGMFGMYRMDGQSCEITEIISHERASIPASDLLYAYPENIIPNSSLSEYCRSAIVQVHTSGRPLSITVPIASPEGQIFNRHIHLEKDTDGSIIAIVGWVD